MLAGDLAERPPGIDALPASSSVSSPSPRQVRTNILDNCRDRSWLIGLGVWSAAIGVWVTVFYAGLMTDAIWLKACLGVALGFATGVVFVIGHDCAHRSLVPRARINRIMAQVAFLPSQHPVCTWETGHNKLHHGWTCLLGKDEGYPPLSPQEFAALPPWRQALHRFYRSPAGLGFYDLVDIWWRCQILALPAGFRDFRRRDGWIDYGLVGGFLLAQLVVATRAGMGGALANCLLMIALPFVVWNFVMAFVTFQHHTHPGVVWYRDQREWNFFRGQVRGTVHVQMPVWLDVVFGRIFQHTAHHVDKTIPLYHLVEAQRALEDAYPRDVCVAKLSLSNLLSIIRACQVFDYEAKCWMTFDAAIGRVSPVVPAGGLPTAHEEAPRWNLGCELGFVAWIGLCVLIIGYSIVPRAALVAPYGDVALAIYLGLPGGLMFYGAHLLWQFLARGRGPIRERVAGWPWHDKLVAMVVAFLVTDATWAWAVG